MTGRDRLGALFQGTDPGEPVVCMHTWGRYPFEFLGEEGLWDRGDARAYADVYEAFQRRFPCDWLHVAEGWCAGRPIPAPEPAAPPETAEEVQAWVRMNRDGQTWTEDQVLDGHMYAHVSALAPRLGREVMIFPNQGAPGSGFPRLSWEDQLILIQRRPELVEGFVRADHGRFLNRVRAARACGADGYIFSEGYCGACDLTSPETFERVFLEPKREFYDAVRCAGLRGVGYFLGGILPYLDVINRMGVDGVMIEETKKTFRLDPVEIRKRLASKVVLFGNTDSCLLLAGTREQIRDEVRRQARARDCGLFAFVNGSPICPGTPPDNLDAYLEAARNA